MQATIITTRHTQLNNMFSLGRLRSNIENIINQYYECKCDIEFLNKNPNDIIIRTRTYVEMDNIEIKKILNSAGFRIKEVTVIQ